MDFILNTFSSGSEIRLSIFLITGVCVGLPALFWAFYLLHLHAKIKGQISSFILLLLLSDLTQLLLNLYTITQLLKNSKIICWNPDIFYFWAGLHLCGLHLHQLVALEGVLTLKFPLRFAHISSFSCYIKISILVLIFSIVSALVACNPMVNPSFSLATILASLGYLATTSVITFKVSPTPVRQNTRSVFAVAILTFVMLYLPVILINCVNVFKGGVNVSWFVMSFCLLSLRVISDPLLCVLICRGNLRQHKHTQHQTLIRRQSGGHEFLQSDGLFFRF